MTTVLYIQASPRGQRSKSIAAADAFIDAYQKRHPQDRIVRLNLFDADLPVFDAAATAAKFKVPAGQPATDEESKVWSKVEAVIEQFKSADKYVLAVPMWNFSIPYRLKQYIDVIVQPNYTFKVTDKGYEGLVAGKPLAAFYARGGAYPKGTPAADLDLQTRYVELIFGFMGFAEMHPIVVEPTLHQGEDGARKALDAAVSAAKTLAESF